jgi:predicted DNA-binding protein
MLTKRLNYNVPQDLTPAIRMLAEMDGTTPAYWLRKALEKVVSERFSVNSNHQINLGDLSAIRGE